MLKTFLQENQLIVPSYQLYGGFSGYQDYGILGAQLKNKLIALWKAHFLDNNIYEIETPSIMPYDVLKASGHVDRFTDYILYDAFGVCHRADHYVKKWFDDNKMDMLSNQVDSMSQADLELAINKFAMTAPSNVKKWFMDKGQTEMVAEIDTWSADTWSTEIVTNMILTHGMVFEPTKVLKKNLMIDVPSNSLGKDAVCDFLRPEIAQGIFVNYLSYMKFLQLEEEFSPFGIAQVGKSYRREISPQQFTRMREFTQAEIEYFVDPQNMNYPGIELYHNIVIPILTAKMQESNVTACDLMTVKQALDNNIISNQLIAYFLAKIYLFAINIGLKDTMIRFRQHQLNEMSHYARQCWDLECYVDAPSGFWLECVGCADRGIHDLSSHSTSARPLCAKRRLNTPIVITSTSIKPKMASVSKKYGSLTNNIRTYFRDLNQESAINVAEMILANSTFTVNVCDSPIEFESTMFDIVTDTKEINYENFVPNVIEPSFGIDRIIYSVLSQNVWQRPSDTKRVVLSLPKELILYDVAVFPLHKKDSMICIADKIRAVLMNKGLKCYVDNSGTAIGKKYVRCDEIGVYNVITVDPGTVQTGMITVRQRDTMVQDTIHYDTICDYLRC